MIGRRDETQPSMQSDDQPVAGQPSTGTAVWHNANYPAYPAAGAQDYQEGTVKRDMDLIRKILEYRESQPWTELVKLPEFPDVSAHEVCYHAWLCRDGGFVLAHAEVVSEDGPLRILHCRIGPLTWQGHELLEALRLKRPCG